MDLAGRVVVITGSARGIGRAVALGVAARGAQLALFDLDAAALDKTCAECQALGVRANAYVVNVAREGEVIAAMTRVVADFGRLDVLVNNAGIIKDSLLVKTKEGRVVDKMSLSQWQAVVDVNLTAVFLCGREAAERMILAGNGGVIVNISSVSRHGNAGQTNYSATKAGVVAMAQVWAKELARHGIRAAAVAPGYTRTEILAAMRADVLEKVTAPVPLKRLGEAAEIAASVVFILENDYFTGRCLDVDGGLTL